MEKPILIIVTIVVLLLVGIIVLAFFTGGLQNFNKLFEGWYTSSAQTARCQADCAQACLTQKNVAAPTVPSCTGVGACNCETTGSQVVVPPPK